MNDYDIIECIFSSSSSSNINNSDGSIRTIFIRYTCLIESCQSIEEWNYPLCKKFILL